MDKLEDGRDHWGIGALEQRNKINELVDEVNQLRVSLASTIEGGRFANKAIRDLVEALEILEKRHRQQ